MDIEPRDPLMETIEYLLHHTTTSPSIDTHLIAREAP
jgi:hypothetical protein